ncbi:DNA-primase RepB domain-containing protein [Heliobacterium mobile]|uniref:DNA-primase RepB domain-containing protein n=1 Tax=Heliobacterium mobile TaxID=28064 RepID=UPI0014791FD8|nr:DNA-primase RepB domain-containing protein [Heliobacterium mobile]
MNEQKTQQSLNTVDFLKLFHDPGEIVHAFVRQENGGDAVRDIPFEYSPTAIAEAMTQLEDYNRRGFGVYFVVNTGGTKDSEITGIRAHFMEMDDVSLDEQRKLIDNFPLDPSLLVYSGGKSYHAYWFVQDAKVSMFRHIQERLIKSFNSDPSLVNSAQKMRLPGFNNCKPNGHTCEVIHYSGKVYRQEDIVAATPDVYSPVKVTRQFDCDQSEYAEFRDMVVSELDKAKDYDNKTSCRCIYPDHKDRNASTVFFWDSGNYYCHVCGNRNILDALEYSGDFDDAVDFAKINGLYRYGDEAEVIQSVGQSFEEYVEDVWDYAHVMTDIPVINIGDLPEISDPLAQEIARLSAKNTIRTMSKRNKVVQLSHARDVENLARLFGHPEPLGKITAIAGQPGFSKTTLMKQFGRTASALDHSFGAIFVCRTKNDMHDLASYLNGVADIDGHEKDKLLLLDEVIEQKAFIMESWNPKLCSQGHKEYTFGMCYGANCDKQRNCPLIKQYGLQKRYPIVIMTHERLMMDNERDGYFVSQYGQWEDYLGKRHRRRVMIIDEKPELIRSTILDSNSMKLLVKKVQDVVSELNDDGKKYYRKVKDINEIAKAINLIAQWQISDSNLVNVSLDEESMKQLKKSMPGLRSFLRKHIGMDEFKLFYDIEHLFMNRFAVITTHHGIKDESKNWQISFARWRPIASDSMNVFILDGTSDISADYADPRRFQRYDCADIRSYKNWTIYQAKISISKTKLSQPQDIVAEINQNVVDVVRRDILPRHKRTLVVTLKNNATSLSRLFANEISEEKVTVAYDGNLIGTNEYQDYTCVVFTSRIEYPPALIEANHALVEQSILGRSMDELGYFGTYGTFRYRNRVYYTSASMEAVRLLKTAENMVQGSLRIDRDPNSSQKVEMWLFDKNPYLAQFIQQKKLKGCLLETVAFEEFKQKKSDAATYKLADIAVEALQQRADDKLPKKELAKLAGIKERALAWNLSREDVQKAFEQKGLKISHRYVERS